MFVLSSCNYLDIVPTGKVIPEKVTEFRALLTNGYSAFPKYKYLLSLRSGSAEARYHAVPSACRAW